MNRIRAKGYAGQDHGFCDDPARAETTRCGLGGLVPQGIRRLQDPPTERLPPCPGFRFRPSCSSLWDSAS